MTTGADVISVLVAEDNRDLCDVVCTLIDAEPGLRVAGTVARVADLLDTMQAVAARVLVLDLDLDGESSVPALQALRARHPQLAVVIFSGNDRDALGPVVTRLGRCEYVMKSGDPTSLLDAIRRSAHG